jgi:hypothetical protein
MEVKASPMTIADYCLAYKRDEIIINRKYQRSDMVWPSQARSFLIETICSGYPLPKFILNQLVIDPRSKKPSKEIVDGQQRSKVINDFYDNKLRLSRNLALRDIAGKLYDEIPEIYQQKFLNCMLDIDLFVNASFADVVESFRRLNSYTFPLNAPEKRHARYQRGFKWMIFYFCRQYESYLNKAEVFTEKSLVRMNDTTLVAEIWHAIENGILTTKAPNLDKLYRLHDIDPFDPEPTLTRLSEAFDTLQDWTGLYGTSLCSHYMIYALALALIHIRHRVPTLESVFPSPMTSRINEKRALLNLTTLATAFDSKDSAGPFGAFIDASTEMTNVESQRKIRFRTFCEALTKEL